MFQSLRQNSPIYVFHKGDRPYLETGYITAVSLPKPKYAVPQTFGLQEMVVDLVVKINNQSLNYTNLPALLDVADSYSNGENITLSGSREAMNAEILAYKQKSVDTINSIETHKSIVSNCDSILQSLNPEYAEKQQQQEEINSLKSLLSEMSKNILDLMSSIGTLTEKEKQK